MLLIKKCNLNLLILWLIPFVLYLIGYAYYSGHLNYYNLSSSQFPISIQEIYIHTYTCIGYALLLSIQSLIEHKFLFVLIIFISCFIFVLGKILWQKINNKLDNFRFNFTEKTRIKVIKILDIIGITIIAPCEFAKIILNIVLVFLCFIIFYWGLFVFPYQIGQDNAKQKIEKFSNQGCGLYKNNSTDKCDYIYDANNILIASGLRLAFNSSNNTIALLQKDNILIMKIKDEYTIKNPHKYSNNK